MHEATLCYLLKDNKILLGYKKEGFGKSNYNGFGGKVKPHETIEEASLREVNEEIGVTATLQDLTKVGKLTFYFPHKPEWNQIVHIYLLRKWNGIPQESNEMIPKWFDTSNIPYNQMWPDDLYWLPLVLKGKGIEASFTFSPDHKSVLHYSLKELNL